MANNDPSEWKLIDTDLVTVLGILPASESHLYLALNEPGAGELKIPLESALANSVENGMFAQCSYRGQVRGGFFVENTSKGEADAAEGGGKWLSLSGRGALALLDDGIVYPDSSGAKTRDFTGMSRAAILITLIDEAQARGALLNLSYDFSVLLDSDGQSWSDSNTPALIVGMKMLEVVRSFSKSGIDFNIVPGVGNFVLSAYKLGLGSDKSETVYFRTGLSCEEITSDERGDKINNALLVEYKGGFINVDDAISILARRRREELLDLKMAQTSASATTIGAAEIELKKNPKKGISLKVYDGVGPRVFVDYGLGDYIILDVNGVETRYRIFGVQPNWVNNKFASLILELNSILYENDIQMAQDVAWLMDQMSAANDAGLLAVSYWATIGDPNFTYNVGDFCIIGDVLYMTHSTGIYSYGLTTGQWNHAIAITLPNCMVAVGTDLYIGGALVLTKYDTLTGTQTTFTLTFVAEPLAKSVKALAVNGSTLYASGYFDTIDGVAAVGIAQCDTTTDTWTAMADEASHVYPARKMLFSNGLLYSVSELAAAQVQAWNGTTWANIGSAFTAGVFCFAEYGADLLAGVGDPGGIYIWDGATWAVFGGGVNGTVRAIAVNLTDVYAAGSFTDAGSYIARYSGGTWWLLGTGLNALVDNMILHGDDVIVAGDFTTAGDKPAQGIAMYINSFESLVDYLENSSSSFNMGAAIHAATASAISNSDEMPFWEDVSNALRKITWANIKATAKIYFDTLYVALTGNQTVAGVKTFSSDPIIPDEAYDATAWNGVLEPPTKNAVRDKIESMSGGTPGGSDSYVQYNNGGAFGGEADFAWDDVTKTFLIGGSNWYSALSALTGGIHVSKDGGGAFTNVITGHSWVDGVDDFTGVPFIGADRAGGSRSTPTAILDNMGLARFGGGGYDGTNLSGTRAQVLLRAAGNWSATSHPTKIEFWTTPVSSVTRRIVGTLGEDGNFNILSGKTYNVNGSPHGHTDLQPLDSDLTAIAGLSPANDDVIQRKAGSWVNRAIAQLWADIIAYFPIGYGTWTPTGTTGTNVAAMTTGVMHYVRIGNGVIFHGLVQIDPTAVGAFTCYLSIPIASDFTLATDASGNGTQPGAGIPNIISIREDATNNRLQLDGYSQTAANTFYRLSGGYVIK